MKSTALPFDEYRDPALIYEDAQQKTCAGCVWINPQTASRVEHCGRGETFGKRCEHYSERIAGTCYCLKCRKITQVFGSNWCAECYYPGIDRDWKEEKKNAG